MARRVVAGVAVAVAGGAVAVAGEAVAVGVKVVVAVEGKWIVGIGLWVGD